MNGGQESAFDDILMDGHTQKHDAIQKQKGSIHDKNEWEYTHNNQHQHPPAHLFSGRREIREKTVLDGRRQRQTEKVDLFPL